MTRLPTRRLLFGALVFIGSVVASGQAIDEDFAGGFDPALPWAGDTSLFTAIPGGIRLDDADASGSSVASIWLPAATADTARWVLAYDQAFSPSTSNRLVWWLAADRPLDQPGVQGYYVMLGGISGSDDAFELRYDDGSGAELIAATASGSASQPLSGMLVVTRDLGGTWRLTVDTDGGNFVASNDFPEPLAGRFAGLTLRYTATRSEAFEFAGFGVSPIFVDTDAPTLLDAVADGPRAVRLTFDEALGGTAAAAASNYSVENNAVVTATVTGSSVGLALSSDLASGRATAVDVQRVSDVAGNVGGPYATDVTYVAPRQLDPYELLITEIMADPSPPLGLPEEEYIELYNATGDAIQLDDARLQVGSNEVALPAIRLGAGEYVALLNGDAMGDDRFVSFADMPALTNSGALVQLLSRDGSVVDAVDYRPSWHAPTKDDGGFSLERIDLGQPCTVGAVNWGSSDALSGGTPAAENSLRASVGVDSLRVDRLTLAGDREVIVALNRSLLPPLELAFVSAGRDLLEVRAQSTPGVYLLTFDDAFAPGEVYELSLGRAARTCASGAPASAGVTLFGLAEEAVAGDWRINEIMYDPLAGQGRWVEVANVSDRLLSTESLDLARTDAAGVLDELFEPARVVLVPPGGLAVFADDADRLREEYPSVATNLLVPADVPTLADEACVQLFDAARDLVYERVCYTEDWHNRAFANTDGVSLERIDLDGPANEAFNWTSAASTTNFATPTQPNSQARNAGQVLPEGEFALASSRISPDNDGFEDLLRLDYAFGDPETLARFEVYDLAGRPVFTADEDFAPGAGGTWTWDGVDDDGGVAAVGTYVLRLTYFSPNQSRSVEHLAFSLVTQR